jgi:cobalt-zinc-cadmium efflux system protein
MDDPGGCSHTDDPSQSLYIVLGFDLVITLVELTGALQSGSLMLWENFGTGVLDGTLLALNIWGLNHETRQKKLCGRRIAYISDLLLATVFMIAILAGLTRLMTNTNNVINGTLVFGIAVAATIMNAICAKLCPEHFINGRSARLKMQAGSWVGAATVITGLTIHYWHWYWIDPVVTVAVGLAVLLAVRRRLTEHNFNNKPLFFKSRAA